MMQKLKKLVPPGFKLKSELFIYIIGNIAAFIYSAVIFGTNLYAYFGALYIYEFDKKILIDGAVMRNFYLVAENGFSLYALMLMVSLAMMVFHYASHFQQSKSIYLMRRLPDKTVLHKRCLILPLIAVSATLLLAVFSLIIYYQIYIHVTPKQCLTANQLEKLFNNWRFLL